jgi:hypothetical protein
MFDIMTYAADNACSITTTPLIETDEINGLKKIGSWHIIIESDSGRCEKIIDPCIQDFEKELDSMLAEIGRNKAAHYSAKRFSAQMAEREKFFKML